uniref:Uncharacterized protein n=1 Tax=Kalanchoe fedtschenkoi TaxID=63787 RepID=A0A7N0RB43_KALFE
MVLTSASLPSTVSSFHSNPTSDYPPRLPSSELSRRSPKFPRPPRPAPALKVSATFTQQSVDEGSPEVFLQNNSIADFMRFERGGRSGELQTAVVSYRKRFPWSLLQPFLQIDLVSTIHIADKEYFKALKDGLEPYDCVLYEMVASRESLETRRNPGAKRLKGTRPRGFNVLGCIQRQMARVLMLDFQLDCLDYQAENWYHADLDFETFKQLQEEKGESLFTFAIDMTIKSTKALVQAASIPDDLGFWRSKLLWASRSLPMPLVGLLIIGGICMDMGSQESEYSEIEALSRLDIGAALKVFLAKRLTSEFTQVTAEIEENSVIIGERNKAAVEALKRALDEGHNRIAILYGGGHMPDLGRRLRDDFDLVPSRVQWVTAWSITKPELNTNSLPFLKTMAEISGWPLNRYQTLALLIFSSVLAVDLWFWELFFGTTVNWASETASQAWQYLRSSQVI